MSLHHIAKHVASKGRDEDTLLVHMTPREVAGLQQIAMAAGGSLTVNPDTGLPEAGFLKSLLPMIAGGIATMFSGGMLAPILAGAATGAATGDKDQSLLMRAGLGALGGFGGAGIGQALGGAAAAGTAGAAGTVAPTALTNAAATGATTGAGTAGSSLLAGGSLTGQVVNPVAGILGNTGAEEVAKQAAFKAFQNPVGFEAMTKGAGNMVTDAAARTAFMNTMPFGGYGLAAAGAPTIAEAMKTPEFEMPEEEKRKFYTTTYNPGTKSPAFGQAGEEYFTGQGYGPTQTYDSYDDYLKQTGQASGMAMGGLTDNNYADGGAAPAAKNPLQDYMAGMGTPSMSMGSGAGSNPLQDYMSSIGNISERSAQARPATIPSPTIGQRPGGMFEGGREYSGAFAPLLNSLRGMNEFSGTGTGIAPKYDPATKNFSFAEGGIASIGGYSDGGRLLRGPGDGVSDDIPAMIHRDDGSKQEARLADGEFVFPARIVSEIGNGSTEAGARKLYAVMDKIQQDRARTIKNVALDTNADRHLQALA